MEFGTWIFEIFRQAYYIVLNLPNVVVHIINESHMAGDDSCENESKLPYFKDVNGTLYKQ